MKENKSIIRGIYINYLHFFIKLLAVFLITPIIMNKLGQSMYGIWAVFGSAVGYFGLFDIGLSTAMAKYTAEYSAKNEKQSLSRLVSSMTVLVIFLGLIIVLSCLALAHFIPQFFHIPEDLKYTGQILFLMMGLNVALRLIADVFGYIIYGYQRVDVWRVFGMIQVVASALLTIFFLYLGFGLIGVAVASILSTLLLLVITLLFIKRSDYGIEINLKLANITTIKNIIPYSVRTFLLGFTAQILYQTDNIVIGIFLGVAFVSSYAIAFQLCFYSTYIFSLFSQVIFPKFTKLYTLNEIDKLGSLYLSVLKMTVAIVVPSIIFLGFFGQAFIAVWVGEKNFAGIAVLFTLIFMNFFHAFGTPPGLILQAIGKNRVLVYSEALNAVLNLIFSIILIKKIGLVGVALGTMLAHICTTFWVIPLLVCKYAKLKIKEYIFSSILPPLLVGLPVAGVVMVFVKDLYPNSNFFYLGLKGGVVFILYFIVYFIIAANNQERAMYYNLLPKTIRAMVDKIK